MKIGNKDIKEIIVTDKDGGLLATISDEDVIFHETINVELVETNSN